MAPGRHWLDPLARRLLIATRQIPGPSERAAHQAASRLAAHQAAVESDLARLRRSQSDAGATDRLDVNRATAAEWRSLPGCTAAQADLLVRLQAGGVQLSGPEDLQQLLGLADSTLATWLPRLEFHWHGEPPPIPLAPVAVNQAGSAELRTRLALSSQRLQRLQQERARAPFRDLADLQERLQLPATLVESWIGRVSFELPDSLSSGPAPARSPGRGPSLPLTPSRPNSLPQKRPGP